MTRKTGAPFLALTLLCLAMPLVAAPNPELKSYPKTDLKEIDPTSEVVFVVAGDNRGTAQGAPLPRMLSTIFSEISLIRPDFVLWTGDTVYGYGDTQQQLENEYTDFGDTASILKGAVPLYNAPGNHEIHADSTKCEWPADLLHQADAKTTPPRCSEVTYARNFGDLYGSFDYAGAHFIALDTEISDGNAISDDQLRWLKRDLESHKGARAIFVFSHAEFYSSPLIDQDQGKSHPPISNRQELQELFQQYPVKAVFSGHEHLYWHEPSEQHNGIDYFVAGGAGAPLYATPDRGGFSHYLLVRLSGNRVSYQLIEPGRLYTQIEGRCKPESKRRDHCSEPGEAKFWIINSNDLTVNPSCPDNAAQPLPLRGIDVEIDAELGDCADLTAKAEIRARDKWIPLDGFTIDCKASVGHKLHFRAPAIGQVSVRVTVKGKAAK
jgi:hypothetical protein